MQSLLWWLAKKLVRRWYWTSQMNEPRCIWIEFNQQVASSQEDGNKVQTLVQRSLIQNGLRACIEIEDTLRLPDFGNCLFSS